MNFTDRPRLLSHTESVCPTCLRRLPAERVAEGDAVYLVKHCPEHGTSRTVIWRGLASYEAWGRTVRPASHPPVCETNLERGCPFDCGLCPEHRQHTCCVLLEVTQRCNLRCPVCFASAAEGDGDPSVDDIEDWLRLLLAHGPPVNIQLSGGEPTVRDDLPAVVALIRRLGFDFVQLNTNGIRLAKDRSYAHALKQAGLDCVFLQFDGVTDGIYRRIRGADLVATKQAAIERCTEAGVGVVLVPTLVPGVNVHEIGAIIDFALARVPTVRAVHFQPVSYFGRYPAAPADADRITLPEVMAEIERQTGGAAPASAFNPGSAENAYCSFSGKFHVGANGRLTPVAEPPVAGCCSPGAKSNSHAACGCGVPPPGEDAQRARRFVAVHWAKPKDAADACCPTVKVDSFDAFLQAHGHSLCISSMGFQDAWTLDLERLKECFIHVVSPDRRVIPFCAYNLTSLSGEALYRPSCTMPAEAL